mgnify:CR=1 FL=1
MVSWGRYEIRMEGVCGMGSTLANGLTAADISFRICVVGFLGRLWILQSDHIPGISVHPRASFDTPFRAEVSPLFAPHPLKLYSS